MAPKKNAAVDFRKENREYKDSVFVDLFYEDETAEKNLLSLYNALHGTDYQNEEAVHKIKIGNTLYKNFKNDISFVIMSPNRRVDDLRAHQCASSYNMSPNQRVDDLSSEMSGKVIVFGEHQSSINLNMPLRCLMYAGRAYEQLIDKRARYKKQLVKIPAPEFYTFYNGTEEYPLEEELFLSDAYLNPIDGNTLELKVKVININIDKSHEILDKCSVLKEYSQFIDTVRRYPGEKDSIERAVNECIERGILADYLKRKGSEVTNMLIAEYSYEEDMEVTRQEARQEGKKNGIILSGKIFQAIIKYPDLTDQQAAKLVGCNVEDVKNVRKMFEL